MTRPLAIAAAAALALGLARPAAAHPLASATSGSTRQLVPALLGYNLGVELGQIAIVLAAAPLILSLQRHRRLHPIARGLAALICAAGIYWFFQRL